MVLSMKINLNTLVKKIETIFLLQNQSVAPYVVPESISEIHSDA